VPILQPMESLAKFKEIFWDAFHRPKLNSASFKTLWEQLEPVNDHLAGPFYAIYSDGQCDYVFKDKVRFPEINDPDDFLSWCIQLVDQYKGAVESVVTQNETEIQDKRLLLFQTDIKMELADLAYLILKHGNTTAGS
jgi:hypothetical protein